MLFRSIGMPGEDGYSLIRKVRALSACQGGDIPAIALTAFAAESDRARALASGFTRHLSKPVDTLTLGWAVHALLSSQSAAKIQYA